MTKKEMLETIMKELEEGEYEGWAEGYLHDSRLNVSIQDLINISRDFVSCRIIELE